MNSDFLTMLSSILNKKHAINLSFRFHLHNAIGYTVIYFSVITADFLSVSVYEKKKNMNGQERA